MANPPVALQIQKELVDEKKDIPDTAARKAFENGFNMQIGRYKAELEEVRSQMKQALEEEDKKLRQKSQEERRLQTPDLDRFDNHSNNNSVRIPIQ